MEGLFWLLLPVAALSGWYAARREQGSAPVLPRLSPDYFKGINYLLNEQPDKAIEVFTRMLEVDSETVETHLALGNLFRKRGEVDRAIAIHQNLIARTNLTDEERTLALLELGIDFMKSGLLDRAEGLFNQVLGSACTPARRCPISSTSTSRSRTGRARSTMRDGWKGRAARACGR